ncbi:hypothetical protein CHLRE_09g386749v5 [Chlamydomonas reinhardtii]|uniref:Uncharacterized protein n=1 Tax=Chlamydomonas reinhardtii TaxID=3055 RepID=A0A2K3DCG8_CHLRE|nr:uncharacterized protein CHLRE_09g386749v5 [Chlamydomonas reinhardtii]PNW78228.1 hypothetical protein CHLRE_09g386749v5 [Chlamydomonas reinhardtii]
MCVDAPTAPAAAARKTPVLAPAAACPCSRAASPAPRQAAAAAHSKSRQQLQSALRYRKSRSRGHAAASPAAASAPPEASRSHEDEVDRRAGAPPTLGREGSTNRDVSAANVIRVLLLLKLMGFERPSKLQRPPWPPPAAGPG